MKLTTYFHESASNNHEATESCFVIAYNLASSWITAHIPAEWYARRMGSEFKLTTHAVRIVLKTAASLTHFAITTSEYSHCEHAHNLLWIFCLFYCKILDTPQVRPLLHMAVEGHIHNIYAVYVINTEHPLTYLSSMVKL